MARKPSAAPFKLKYTNGKKADSSAFPFMMTTPQAGTGGGGGLVNKPNPAIDQAINKKMDEKITQKVDEAVSKPGASPFMEEETFAQKLGKGLKKAAKVAATAFTGGLDAVYGTGKINPGGDFSFSDKKDKETKEKDVK